MADSQPLVCVFFQLPPSDQLFTRLHDIPWLVLLPQIEKLTDALEALVVTNPSSLAKKTLYQAREAMGSKMLPLRDLVLSSWDFSRHYVEFVYGVYESKNLSVFIKEAHLFMARKAIKKIEPAQQALFEFREELESVVSRITPLVTANDKNMSLFITESSQIISVMIAAIEECDALLQEYNECFENIYKQNLELESFQRNPPSDAEFQLAREKWETLQHTLYSIASDWNLLEARIAIPGLHRAACRTTTPDVRDPAALIGIPEDLANPEVPSAVLPPKKTNVPFWRKLFQRISTCISSRPFR